MYRLMIMILWTIFSLLLFYGCAEETNFKAVVGLPGNDMEIPEEIIKDKCEIYPYLPECYTFCEIFPDDEICSDDPVDCSETPELPECKSFCEKFPTHHDCVEIDYCEKYPESIECLSYCLAFPEDPDCSDILDCLDTPEDPSCKLFCDMYPFDPICQTIEYPEYEDASEIFSQNEKNNVVDIIWIVDNSGSMEDEQNDIADNFESFIDAFLENETDFKMGITSTDTDGPGSVYRHNGEFLGRVPVLTSEMSTYDVKKNFMKNIRVGTSGSGRERGLEAATMALTKNLHAGSNNYDFIRENAFLAIIVVSDENDSSLDSTFSYIEEIKNYKADNPERVAIYSIVDTVAQSHEDPYYTPIDPEIYYHGWINPGGQRYMSASEETDGFYKDIHSDFVGSLLDIGSGIVELINSFKLQNIPIISTIVVKVNGIEIEESEIDGWVYDDSTGSIAFKGAAVPEPGASISIDYTYIK